MDGRGSARSGREGGARGRVCRGRYGAFSRELSRTASPAGMRCVCASSRSPWGTSPPRPGRGGTSASDTLSIPARVGVLPSGRNTALSFIESPRQRRWRHAGRRRERVHALRRERRGLRRVQNGGGHARRRSPHHANRRGAAATWCGRPVPDRGGDRPPRFRESSEGPLALDLDAGRARRRRRRRPSARRRSVRRRWRRRRSRAARPAPAAARACALRRGHAPFFGRDRSVGALVGAPSIGGWSSIGDKARNGGSHLPFIAATSHRWRSSRMGFGCLESPRRGGEPARLRAEADGALAKADDRPLQARVRALDLERDDLRQVPLDALVRERVHAVAQVVDHALVRRAPQVRDGDPLVEKLRVEEAEQHVRLPVRRRGLRASAHGRGRHREGARRDRPREC